MSSGSATLRACATAAAAALAAAGCGGDGRQDAGDRGASYTVDLERVRFPAIQRLAKSTTLEITVRNAGDRPIANLAVTVRGLSARAGDSDLAEPRRSPWVVDEPPAGGATAIQDTWALGALAPDRRMTLRWRLTPVVAGSHRLRYEIAGNLSGEATTTLTGGGPAKGSLAVAVIGKPARARVDPRTGAVLRDE